VTTIIDQEERMDPGPASTIEAVKAIVVETLGIEERADTLDAGTTLLGALPELDSMAVLELVVALERHFGIVVEDDDVSAETFESLGSLAAFVDGRLS